MRSLPRSVLFFGLICTSFGSGRADPPPAPAPAAATSAAPGAALAFPCGPVRHVRTGAELLAALSATWPRPGVGISPVTVDLIADVALTVRSDKLHGPGYCTSRCTHKARRVDCTGSGDPCRVPVRFRVNTPVSGVKVDGQSEAHEGVSLSLQAGSRFRLRQRVLEFHPEAPYYDPMITVEQSCNVPCQPNERRCAATEMCVPNQGDSYCLACRGLSRPECACRTPDGALIPDGTSCTFLSGDYFPTGTCKKGRCEMQRQDR